MSSKSRLGLASLLFFIGVVLLNIVVWVAFFGLAVVHTQGNSEEGRSIVEGFGAVFIASPFLHLIGAGLGVAGLVRREPKKAFSIIGLILNLMFCVGGLLFFLLAGLAASM